MQRWLARQTKGHPRVNVALGIAMIAIGVGSVMWASGSARIMGLPLLPLGALQIAAGVAELRESRSAPID